MNINLRPYQQEALERLGNGKILCGAVGSGKSLVAVSYFFTAVCGGDLEGGLDSLVRPVDLYIITTAKKRDSLEWMDEAAKFSIVQETAVSVGNIRLVVDSWNNIGKYVGVSGAMFIFDEQRLVGSGAWVKSFLKIAKGNRWILLSATPADTWSDYIPVFVANGFYTNKTEFLREHAVYNRYSKYPKVDRWIGLRRLSKYRDQLLVGMEYERPSERRTEPLRACFDDVLMRKVVRDRWNPWKEAPIVETGELFQSMRRVVNENDSRLQLVRELLVRHPRVIVFYNFDYELELLRGLVGEVDGLAEWNGHKHEPVPEGESWVYLVQYAAGAEGWNCVATDTIIFYSLNYSYRMTEQAMGRIDRMNTPFKVLNYYFLKSDAAIDRAIWKALKAKKSFNEGRFKL